MTAASILTKDGVSFRTKDTFEVASSRRLPVMSLESEEPLPHKK